MKPLTSLKIHTFRIMLDLNQVESKTSQVFKEIKVICQVEVIVFSETLISVEKESEVNSILNQLVRPKYILK